MQTREGRTTARRSWPRTYADGIQRPPALTVTGPIGRSPRFLADELELIGIESLTSVEVTLLVAFAGLSIGAAAA